MSRSVFRLRHLASSRFGGAVEADALSARATPQGVLPGNRVRVGELLPHGAASHLDCAKAEADLMDRSIIAVFLGLLLAAPCSARESLVGTYTLVSVTRSTAGKLQESPGKPHGYTIITPTYYIVLHTDGTRKYGASDTERIALWETMAAYAGRYHFDGKTLTVSVDTF